MKCKGTSALIVHYKDVLTGALNHTSVKALQNSDLAKSSAPNFVNRKATGWYGMVAITYESMGTVKRKRVSKKNKKSWRKNVDIKDVDDFLEDQRLEERLGVKYSKQKDSDLFQIDTEGGDENVKPADTVPEKEIVKSVSLRLRETETPKCYEALVKRSAVAPHIIRKTRIKKEDGKSQVAKQITKRRKGKELLAVLRKAEGTNVKKKEKKIDFSYDVWSTENNDRNLNGCAEWLSNDAIRHTLHNTGKLRKQIPKAILSKTSLLPAIESPHPGLSYNPSLKDHTDILQKVAESEVELIKEEKHLDRVTTKMYSKIPKEKLEKEWLHEMTVGLSMKKTDSDEEDIGEYRAINPPVKNKKKTLKKRRKLREQLLLKEKLKRQKIEKRKLSDIYKLRKFKEMLDKKEEKTLKNIEKRKKIKEQKPFTTKVLSQTKYEEPEIEFHLAEELSGNLRNVNPEGSILYDRFKSLQKRNILQPTLKRHVKKRKMKKYERANTKMGWEPKGYEPFEGTKRAKKK